MPNTSSEAGDLNPELLTTGQFALTCLRRVSQSLQCVAFELRSDFRVRGVRAVEGPAQLPINPALDMDGCQNYGPFLGPCTIRHLIFRVPRKGP